MFKIGDSDLAPSLTRPGSSSASDASGRGVVCPSHSSPGASSPSPSSPRLPRRPTETAPVDAPALQRRAPLLGGIILWLDAVGRVVLSEVEHATYKNSRISWALRMDWEWHYNMDTIGIPAEHTQSVFQLECEWRCETESTILFAILAYRAIRRIFAGLDASIIDSDKFLFEIACQPSTGKVGRQTYWHWSVGF
jgi:hypothetical protein